MENQFPAHPVCEQMRELRRAAGLSLVSAGQLIGIPSIVLGSYERGDRQPPLIKAERIVNGYGYTLAAVPNSFDAIRLPADMAQELRAIANQLDREKNRNDVPDLSHSATSFRRL